MVPKIIKNESDYEAALDRINALMDAEPRTPAGDELELLATLVELYENKVHPVDLPDPIGAIKFRMEQQNLTQKDLIPWIGSRSKVSEVLSLQRSLSLSMIRKLHEGLGIPGEVLIRQQGSPIQQVTEGIEWECFPLAEMIKRRWLPAFQGRLSEAKTQAEDLIRKWAAPLGPDVRLPALFRQHVRAGSETDGYALAAWRMRVSLLALDQNVPKYQTGTVTRDFIRDLVRLSYLDNGPLLAREFLLKNGIHFVTEEHLPRTHLDGAAIRLPDGSPLVAMTLRHDRMDNFWFTLCHELAHIALHFNGEEMEAFFDDLDVMGNDAVENDADCWATEALIPAEIWQSANLGQRPSLRKIIDFAAFLRISPAIPAGRIRREACNYRIFSKLVGYKQVRKLVA
ncbi:MAG: ImmA/IrrE family metallo-endopeptidase [Deltaproteobacteria bacterium]|nr:ImmA/IrrE family metallo-endopeptidase [Deltaproteobacteria bacterium]